MTIQTVSLPPSLIKRIQFIAQSTGVSADAFVETAVKQRVDNWYEKQMGQEALAYNRLHSTLVIEYLGKFVAILGGNVVDHDRSLQELKHRMCEQYDDKPIFITQVQHAPLSVFNAPRPRLNKRP